MALVIEDGNIYHYVYLRVHEEVLRIYSACGDEAIAAQADDDENRRQRQEKRRALAQIEDQHRQAARIERQQRRAIGILVGLVFGSSGYVRYQRGNIKRRTMRALPNPSSSEASRKRLATEIRRLANSLLAGDETVLRRLQELNDLYPEVFGAEIFADLPRLALDVLASHLSGGNRKLRDDLIVRTRLNADKLAGDSPSEVKRRCAIWAALCEAQAYALIMVVSAKQPSQELRRRTAAAGRQYMHAMKTVAQINALEEKRPRRERPKAFDAEFKVIR